MFSETTKMADVVLADDGLLDVLPNLGIGLGFGEKTLARVCGEAGASTPLVVLVCNLHAFDDYTPDGELLDRIPIEGVVDYLRSSHRDYLEVRMPRVISAVLALPGGEMLATFCEKYRQEVMAHFGYEEQVVFPYIAALLSGGRPLYRIGEYARNHSDIDGALEDLKNIIVKYLPPASTIECSRPVLRELFAFERDVRKHTLIEEEILIPLVGRLDREDRGDGKDGKDGEDRRDGGAPAASGSPASEPSLAGVGSPAASAAPALEPSLVGVGSPASPGLPGTPAASASPATSGSPGSLAPFDDAGLSVREVEVLRLLASGLSNKQIADRLFISTHTAISHRKNIMRKTGFKSAQGLTFFALHRGLVTSSDFC
jgi:regulator of cell morphogenesis and NO signaling